MCHTVHAGFGKAHLCHPDTDGAPEQADENFVDHQRGEELGVRGLREALHKARGGVDNTCIERCNINGAPLLNWRQTLRKHFQNQPGDLAWIEVQPARKIRIGMAGAGDLRSHGQSHGEYQDSRGVVFESLLPGDCSLCALCDDAQGRHLEAVHALGIDARKAADVQAGNAQIKGAVVRCIGGDASRKRSRSRFVQGR